MHTLQTTGAEPLSRPSSTGLCSLFDATWQSPDAGALKQLRETCIAFVRRLRTAGDSPEQVLVALKREVAIGRPVQEDDRRTHMYDKVFRWFLDAYFDL